MWIRKKRSSYRHTTDDRAISFGEYVMSFNLFFKLYRFCKQYISMRDEQWASRWICNKRVILQFSCMTNIITDQHTHTRQVQNDVQARAHWAFVLRAHVSRFSVVKPNFPIDLIKCHCGCESKVHYEWILLKHNWTGAVSSQNTCHLVNVIWVVEQMRMLILFNDDQVSFYLSQITWGTMVANDLRSKAVEGECKCCP